MKSAIPSNKFFWTIFVWKPYISRFSYNISIIKKTHTINKLNIIRANNFASNIWLIHPINSKAKIPKDKEIYIGHGLTVTKW